jgi:lipoprotein-releasing system permease protein
MDQMKNVPGVEGIAPFVISPMMVTHGDKTATGVLLKGVDPELMPSVLDLPRHMAEVLTPAGEVRQNSVAAPLPQAVIQDALLRLRLPGSKPPERRRGSVLDEFGKSSPRRSKTPKSAGSADAPDGGNVPLLRAIEESLADAAAGDPLDAGPPEKVEETRAPPAATGDDVVEGLDPDAPVGSIEPDGGYASPLPEDDVLPEEVDPDPCKDKAAVEKMPGIIIGATLKKNLDVKLGECVQVTSPTIGFTYSRGAIRAPVAKQFKVIAVFDAGFDQYDSKLVYTDLFEAQAFYDSGDSVTGVEMKVSDIDEARAIARHIDRVLSSGIYHTMDWEELNHGLFTALRIQQVVMSAVLAIIIVVAAFTVIATLIMVVLDKKKEIAVLKAMGSADGALLRSFLYQGAIIGVIGTVIGLGLGIAVCKGLLVYGFPLDPKVYFISRLPVQVRLGEFALVGVFAVLVCLIATVWPALYAARLRPAEAFREQQ